jgi:gluconolactonase
MEQSKREFLKAGVGVAAMAAMPGALSQTPAGWQPSARYPDPTVKVVDPSFNRYRLGLAKVERIASNCRWNEGPVWFGDGRYLLWSDTRDRQGRLLTCEHDTRRVTRTEHDGTISVIAERFDGKPLNSPNDIVCKSDGSIWFTDPPFGILGNYEGHVAKPELPTNVYRWDPKTQKLAVATGDVNRPNGLAFSPDESKLYVIEAGATPRIVKVYDVVDGGTKLAKGRTFLQAETGGTPDGFRLDVDGNLWMGWGMGSEALDGVNVFNSEAKLIGRIDLPERCANVCFGGLYRNRLFMAASTSVYSLYVNTQGVAGG